MREFSYEVRNPAGRRLRGQMRSDSQAAALADLRERGYQVITLDDRGEVRTPLWQRLRPSPRPSLREKAVAVRQLAVMINSGVPIVRCLEVLGRQGPGSRMAGAWRDLQEQVLRGSSLSRGMTRRPDVFDLLVVGLARAGETSGALGSVMDHLASLLERDARVEARVKSALTYPAVVFGVCMVLAWVLVQHILPTFLNGVLQGMDRLPWMTRVLVGVTEAAQNPYLLGVGLVAGGFGAFLVRRHLQTPRGRYQWQSMLLRTPVIAELQRRVVFSRFCRTLATLLASGTTVVHALQVTSSAMADPVVAEAVEGVCSDLKDGCGVGESFEACGFFPTMLSRLILVAEEAGDLPGMLNRIAGFYEEELELALESFTAALEPLMVAVMGGVVGFVVVALFLPLYQLLNTL